MSEDPAELFRAAAEEHVRNLSDSEFQALVAKTRPPTITQTYTDPAQRMQQVSNSIAFKQQQKRRQRAQPKPAPSQADIAQLDDAIRAAEQSGNTRLSISLKRQKHAQLRNR